MVSERPKPLPPSTVPYPIEIRQRRLWLDEKPIFQKVLAYLILSPLLIPLSVVLIPFVVLGWAINVIDRSLDD